MATAGSLMDAVAAGDAIGGASAGWRCMALAVAALFLGFKLATLPRAGIGRTLAYVVLWPGMDPRPFEGPRRPDSAVGFLIVGGALRALSGMALVATAVGSDLPPAARAGLAAAGALLAIHMGLFDMLAAAWHRAGFAVERLCPEPWRARTLSEFWGRRWNRAFSDFARDRIHRPLTRRWGRAAATAAVFAFSGIAHELVISLPAGGGWGLPTLYFALHGALVVLEKRGALPGGRVLTAAAVVLPLPILFHAPFLENVLIPMVGP